MAAIVFQYDRNYTNRDGSISTMTSLETFSINQLVQQKWPSPFDHFENDHTVKVVLETRDPDGILLEAIATQEGEMPSADGRLYKRPAMYRIRFVKYVSGEIDPVRGWSALHGHSGAED